MLGSVVASLWKQRPESVDSRASIQATGALWIETHPRILISEWNLGKFPDSMEFQSWKVNFGTGVCLRTADPQVTMHWIKEV